MRRRECNFFSKWPLARRKSGLRTRHVGRFLAKSFGAAIVHVGAGATLATTTASDFARRTPHPALHAQKFRGMSDEAEPERTNAVAIEWKDLGEEEKTALKRMNRGPYPELDPALGERLIALGLADDRPRGIGINRTGRELVIGTLLAARDKD